MADLKYSVPGIGTRFYSWTIIGPLEGKRRHRPRVSCRCDCGTVRKVLFYSLIKGTAKRCVSCTRRLKNPRFLHGEGRKEHRTPEFRTWLEMRRRCFDEGSKDYQNYGARGITVHQDWVDSFSAFVAHIGRRPSPKHTIERIDNEKHYEPNNVRWATRLEQSNNRRNNHTIAFHGQTKSIADWSRHFQINRLRLYKRLLRHHWNLELVVTRFNMLKQTAINVEESSG